MSSGTTTTTGTDDTTVSTENGLIINEGTGITLETSEGAGPNGETVVVINVNSEALPEVAATTLTAGDGIDLEYDESTNSYVVHNDCCETTLTGTSGCEFPADPAEGDVHYNGGDSGWITVFNGTDWLRTCFGTGTELTAVDTGTGETALWVVQSCDAATGVAVVTPGNFGIQTINGAAADSTGDFDICGLDDLVDEPDAELTKFLVCEDGTAKNVSLEKLVAKIVPLFAEAFAGMTSAQKRAFYKELFSEDGSGWIGPDDRYGENDGLSGTAGYTDISAL